MAEIKSTLDLVLERTRHLKMSADEKRQQQAAQFERSLAGLVQRCLDGALRPEEAQVELRRLEGSAGGLPVRRLLAESIVAHLDSEQKNEPLLALLGQESPLAPKLIVASLEKLRGELDRAEIARQMELLTALRQRHGIEGTAVLVNLDADAQWKDERGQCLDAWRQALAAEIGRLPTDAR